MTDKQKPSQSVIKAEIDTADTRTEGNSYEQNGNLGIGGMNGGEIQNGAKVAGKIYEGSSNNVQTDSSINNSIKITICTGNVDSGHKSTSEPIPVQNSDNKSNNSTARFVIVCSQKNIKRAEKALVSLGFDSKNSLAKYCLLSRNTVTKFFNQQPIQPDSFKRICEALKLNWQ